MSDDDKRFESYYDGIPQDIKEMTPQELEESLEKEKLKCDQMKEW